MRPARLLAPLAIAASAALPQINANAINTLAFTFPVLCADTNGTASDDDFGGPNTGIFDLTAGTYVVTVAGACTTLGRTAPPIGSWTPCNEPVLGTPVPCVDGRVHNLPDGLCQTTTTGARTECSTGAPNVVLNSCGVYNVDVDGTCITQAGLHKHNGGPMRVRFVDGDYTDNVGVLLVTVVWTPL